MIESILTRSSAPVLRRLVPTIPFARQGVLALGIRLACAGAILALQISLARVLGHSGYGEYAFVLAWLQLILIFAQGGFSTAALRYVAEYRARHQPALVRGFLRRSSQITLLVSITLALFMAGCAVALRDSMSAGSLRSFLVASAALPVLSQFMLGSAVVRGLGHVIADMLVSLAQPLLILSALFIAAHVLRFQITASEALLLYLGAAIASLAMVFGLRRRFERDLHTESQRDFLTGEWLGTATQMMFASSLIYLQGRTGVIITGLLLDARAAGTYAAMERLADATLLGLTSVNLLAAPKFAALYAQQRWVELQRYARMAAWGASGFMLATVIPLVLFGKPILRLFGNDFVSGYPVLLILLGGVAVNAMCGSVGLLLNMTGHQFQLLLVASSSLCINLILSLLLIPRYGIIGTSAAFAVSMAVWNIAMLLIVRRRLGISPCIGPVR